MARRPPVQLPLPIVGDRPPATIRELFAYVCQDDQGGEDVPVGTVAGSMAPLMGADPDRCVALERAAQDAANRTGRPVHLCVFRGRERVKTFHPAQTAA